MYACKHVHTDAYVCIMPRISARNIPWLRGFPLHARPARANTAERALSIVNFAFGKRMTGLRAENWPPIIFRITIPQGSLLEVIMAYFPPRPNP